MSLKYFLTTTGSVHTLMPPHLSKGALTGAEAEGLQGLRRVCGVLCIGLQDLGGVVEDAAQVLVLALPSAHLRLAQHCQRLRC